MLYHLITSGMFDKNKKKLQMLPACTPATCNFLFLRESASCPKLTLPHKSLPCLREPDFFAQAKAAYGTVVWTDEIDIAPEHLYECSVPISSRER